LVDNGDGTWTYNPAADDNSAVSFVYTIGDGYGGIVAGSATLDLIPVNDAPVVTSNATPSVAENTTAVTFVTSVDVEGDVVQYSTGHTASAEVIVRVIQHTSLAGEVAATPAVSSAEAPNGSFGSQGGALASSPAAGGLLDGLDATLLEAETDVAPVGTSIVWS